MVQEIIEAVIRCDFVKSYDILDFIEEEAIEFLRLKVEFNDNSLLHIRESLALGKSKYSYHWQKANGDLIIRWDNAPHHPEIKTHPFHLHDRDKILGPIMFPVI
ncbi:hypothetical protein JW964_12650 [candidate division KSB1 bacterium]|nr:hypothetical protein [candidate division KSB1 bacterium]